MTIVSENPLLTLTELAKKARVHYSWLQDQLASDWPPPSRKHGARILISWLEYLAWDYAKFGDGGDYRGQGVKQPEAFRRK